MPKNKFHTIVEMPKFKWQTGYSKKNLFVGSCFAENIGQKMAGLKFDVHINPFGILYNPASIAANIKLLLSGKKFTAEGLIFHNELWHSFLHHGRFSGAEKKQTLENINSKLQFSSAYLKNTDFIFITFGTSWIYEYKKNNQVVSNCHKIPASDFNRRRLGVNEISGEYAKLLPAIWDANPGCKIIFTVSPVRHWKDGAIENQRSKATLLLAIGEICNTFGPDRCAYFPSYEIMVDELRDYRFYADDMLHISETGIAHIWGLFEENLIDKESMALKPKIQKITKAYSHRPFNPFSGEYLNFLQSALSQIEGLQGNLQCLNFELEKNHFANEINKIRNGGGHF